MLFSVTPFSIREFSRGEPYYPSGQIARSMILGYMIAQQNDLGIPNYPALLIIGGGGGGVDSLRLRGKLL